VCRDQTRAAGGHAGGADPTCRPAWRGVRGRGGGTFGRPDDTWAAETEGAGGACRGGGTAAPGRIGPDLCDDAAMCGRMTQQTSPEEVARIFDAEVREHEGEPFAPSWNVAPTDPLTVVLQRDEGRMVERVRWGLIPAWAAKPSDGARLINARAESVASSPAFRVAFRARRCIVPSDGFYEWQGAGARRQPYFLGPPADDLGGVLAMAGLWSVWKDPATGSWVPSAAVITTRASGQVAPIHDRMPVLLPRDVWAGWLDPAEKDSDWLHSLLVPAPDDILAIHAVSTRVNNVRNDGPELVEPLDPTQATDSPAQATLFG